MPPKPYFYRQGGSLYQIMSEARFDFRGGRNTTEVPDNLLPTEMVDSTNARVTPFGAIEKRTGSQRINTTSVGAASNGLFQWFAPSGLQTVNIAGGFLYYRGVGFGDFTQVDPGALNRFSTASNTHFAPFRANTTGAPLKLYIASGGRVYVWDGTAISRIDGTNNVPSATLIEAYHTRLFTNDTNYPQFIFWSGVGLPNDFTPSTQTAGGNAMVDVLHGDQINATEIIGSSLLIATKESVVRFTGYSANDIQIAQDTAGVSADIGIVGDNALLRVEQIAFGMTVKGPYAVMEAGMVPVGMWVENDFDDMDRTVLSKVVIGHHHGRREVWFAYSAVGDSGLNKHVLVYNLRNQRWYGPFVYPFGIQQLTYYEDVNGDKWLIAGSSDGFVRHMDVGALDDVLANGTGGSGYTMTVEFAPIFFSAPSYQKTLRNFFLQANLPVGHATSIKYAFDDKSLSTHTMTDTGNAALTLSYRAKLTTTGRRLRLQIVDTSATIPFYGGFIVESYHRERP